MPLYEFECQKCGKVSEILVRSSNWKGAACPSCSSKRLTKKMSTFASNAIKGGGGCSSGSCKTKKCGSCRCGGH